MIFFSIIIPCFNSAQFIERGILSVLNQSYSKFELIIVDDGSTDSTEQILSNFRDKRIKIISQENQGVSQARNVGAEQASGKYLIFLDADDLMDPDYLSKCLGEVVKLNVKLILVSAHFLRKDGKISHVRSPGNSANPKHGITGSFIIERELFMSLTGYDSKLFYSENSDLFLRLYHYGLDSSLISVNPDPFVIVTYEEPSKRVLRHAASRYSSTLYFMNKHAVFFSTRPKQLYNFKRIAGNSAIHIGKFHEAIRLFLEAIMLQPLRLGGWFSLFKLILVYLFQRPLNIYFVK